VPGADVMILKIFSPKNFVKTLAFFAQTTASLCKNVIIILVFEKKATIFLAVNWQKSQKIVIITSTPGRGQGGKTFDTRVNSLDGIGTCNLL
jgi:hypothetical protein